MAKDLRQCLAEAMAATVGSQAFKSPSHAWDGFRALWLGYADAALAVRDEEMERLRAKHATQADSIRSYQADIRKAEADAARVRTLHPSREEADAAKQVLCVECAQPAPCRTRQALDDTAGT